jgi:hypothetical protein
MPIPIGPAVMALLRDGTLTPQQESKYRAAYTKELWDKGKSPPLPNHASPDFAKWWTAFRIDQAVMSVNFKARMLAKRK